MRVNASKTRPAFRASFGTNRSANASRTAPTSRLAPPIRIGTTLLASVATVYAPKPSPATPASIGTASRAAANASKTLLAAKLATFGTRPSVSAFRAAAMWFPVPRTRFGTLIRANASAKTLLRAKQVTFSTQTAVSASLSVPLATAPPILIGTTPIVTVSVHQPAIAQQTTYGMLLAANVFAGQQFLVGLQASFGTQPPASAFPSART
mgnify:FL=1